MAASNLRSITELRHASILDQSKLLGAYYTDSAVAEFISRWALVSGQETVLDPSFGGGVFIAAASERVRQLGGHPQEQIFGVEIDETAYRTFLREIPGRATPGHLFQGSFFDFTAMDLPRVDAIIGNPPFIRYQRFSGQTRNAAMLRARQAGVTLSRLTSAWAPFLVHAVQFIKPGGRLAMVAPMELAHARYALPVLRYLHQNFRHVTVLTFAKRLFPHLSESTVLVLAEGRCESPEKLSLLQLNGIEDLGECIDPRYGFSQAIEVDGSAIADGRERLLHYLLPPKARHLYNELRGREGMARLGALADVGIGYVTGNNAFFHVDRDTAHLHNLPQKFLLPSVRHGSDLIGLSFTREDWARKHDEGHANQLLSITMGSNPPAEIREYLAQGEKSGVPNHYKCRTRPVWYCVPHVHQADCFLSYMNGLDVRLVANEAGAVASNALHVVRLLKTAKWLTPRALAAAWQTSLTALSCEMEGHSLGGGMLKLEPTEAEQVLVASPMLDPDALEALASELDSLLRSGNVAAARERADEVVLGRGAGLSAEAIRTIRDGWKLLRDRRLKA